MISRADTVNLSNMPVISEKPFLDASSSESDKDGKNLGKLAKMFSLKSEGSGDAAGKGWKITKFETSPLVRESWQSLLTRFDS